MTRVLLLTSNHLRHHYFIRALAQSLEVVGVWREEKSFRPERYAVSEDDQRVIAAHFAARDASEEQYFGSSHASDLPRDVPVRDLAPNSINEPQEVEAMRSLEPERILVFGSGILREGIIGAFGGSIINLHLGLSPYYRGSGTNFWPLVNREPEYVGATIHALDAGVDSGDIFCHVRPEPAFADGPHDLGNKTIMAAVRALPAVVEAHVRGKIAGVPQWGGGRQYLRKDFSADAVRRLQENFRTGMMEEYIARRAERDATLRLISPPVA